MRSLRARWSGLEGSEVAGRVVSMAFDKFGRDACPWIKGMSLEASKTVPTIAD